MCEGRGGYIAGEREDSTGGAARAPRFSRARERERKEVGVLERFWFGVWDEKEGWSGFLNGCGEDDG